MTDIMDIVNKYRNIKIKGLKEIAKNIQIRQIDLRRKLEQEMGEKKNKTGTILDEMIGGGLGEGESMLLYGEFGAGKTQTCFTMSVMSPEKVVYIDTEGSFRVQRIIEICEARGMDTERVLDKIILFQPTNWVEILELLVNFPKYVKETDIGLIIMDSLTKRIRGIEFAGRESLTVKQPIVREILLRLEEIARAYKASVVITTQIYESPTANPFLPDWTSQRPVGGASLEHQPDYVIFLRKAEGNIRIARAMDSSYKPLCERPFVITKAGIEDLPQEEKITEKIMKKTEEYAKKHSIGQDIKVQKVNVDDQTS